MDTIFERINCFGSRKSEVQILSPRPIKSNTYEGRPEGWPFLVSGIGVGFVKKAAIFSIFCFIRSIAVVAGVKGG